MVLRRLIPVDERGPLHATRALLHSFWTHSELDSLLIPTWDEDYAYLCPTMLEDPDQLERADPFAPRMVENAARLAVQSLSEHPNARYAFFLRPCEVRALKFLLASGELEYARTTLISSDCLAVFSWEDFEWRLGEVASPEELSLEALHFSAQGGILPSRYQLGCQVCETPFPKEVQIQFNILGCSTSKHLIMEFQAPLAEGFLHEMETIGEPVPSEVLTRRERVLEKITNWRSRSLAYAHSHLDKRTATSACLATHLGECTPCRARMEAVCPLYTPTMLIGSHDEVALRLETWIATCAGCGMCEHECPSGYPLFSVIAYLNHQFHKGSLAPA